jgi:SHS2 domain-containing protein
MGYEHLDISGDAGVRATGATEEEASASAALGMYALITAPRDVAEEKSIRVEVKSHSREGLLVGFLNELVFQFDTYGFVGKRVEVNAMEEQRIDATITGEDFDPARHESNLLIKAATYHGVKVEQEGGGWVAECIFDI